MKRHSPRGAQTAWTAGNADTDIASSSMRTGETANRSGSGCVAIASTGARFRHDEGTALRYGDGSLKDDLGRPPELAGPIVRLVQVLAGLWAWNTISDTGGTSIPTMSL